MRRTRLMAFAGMCGLAMLTGCVSQGDYDNASMAAKGLEAQLQECQNARGDLLSSLELKDQALTQREQQLADMQAQMAAKDAQLGALGDLEGQLGDLHGRVAGLGVIDPATDRALRRLAAQHPNLITYDASTGTVRFASDLTFDSGSATVKESALAGLKEFAAALNTAEGGAYDLRVVGHTDSQRMSNPATVSKFQNNRILSFHRAYAVSESLQSFSVPAGRIETSGWGQYRPLVQNSADGNTPANRRVEVQLVAGRGGAMVSGSDAPIPADTGEAPTRRESFPIK